MTSNAKPPDSALHQHRDLRSRPDYLRFGTWVTASPIPLLLILQWFRPEWPIDWLLALNGVALLFWLLGARFLEETQRRWNLHQSRLGELLGIGSDWHWEQDTAHRCAWLSPQFRLASGLDPSKFLGLPFWRTPPLVPCEESADAMEGRQAALTAFRDVVVQLPAADGSPRFFAISGEAFFSERNVWLGYRGVAREVTEERKARRALDEMVDKFRQLIDASPVGVCLVRDGRILMANSAAARMAAVADRQALVGMSIGQLVHPAYREIVAKRQDAFATMPPGQPLPLIEIEILRGDGTLGLVQVTGMKVMLPDGPAIHTTLIDMSSMRATEAALRRSDQLLSRMFETTVDAVLLAARDSGHVEFVNPTFSRMLGHSREQAVGASLRELKLWGDANLPDLIADRLSRDARVDLPGVALRRRDGEVVNCHLVVSRFMLEDTEYLLMLVRDVSAVLTQRQMNEAILEGASVGIAVIRQGAILQVNPMLARMLRGSTDELLNRPVVSFLVDQSQGSRLQAQARQAVASGEILDLPAHCRRLDGSVFWARLRCRPIDPQTPASGWVVVVEDISAEREVRYQLARAKEAAESANQAKSMFLANTSHEIRTPLNSVLGLARMARRSDDDDRREDLLARLEGSADQLASIISDVLDLSKIEAGKLVMEKTGFDLVGLLDSVIRAHVESAQDRGLELSLDETEDLPQRVVGDPVRVRQVLSNLLGNAIKFTEHGSVRVLASRNGPERVRLEVVDTGIGIAPEVIPRLFMPFARDVSGADRALGGTGLGLAICRELATLMGGEIGVDSALGEGSRFWVELPLRAEDSILASGMGLDSVGSLEGTRILLVEDNEVNRLIAEGLLQEWGVRVVEAEDGQQALQALEREAGAFDAVLMDIHMPNMNGLEACEILRGTWSSQALPVIALTAAALSHERDRALDAGMNDFVSKPIDRDQLRRVLLRWIGRERPTDLASTFAQR